MHDTISHVHDHDHDHDHDQGSPQAHAHDTPHTHTPEQAPENVDNLILDIGADTGALIIHAAVDHDQAEIEISPMGGVQARTHNIVRRREAVSGAVYAAVFPALAAGDYVVWRDDATPAGTVSVRGGRVASFRLDLVFRHIRQAHHRVPFRSWSAPNGTRSWNQFRTDGPRPSLCAVRVVERP